MSQTAKLKKNQAIEIDPQVAQMLAVAERPLFPLCCLARSSNGRRHIFWTAESEKSDTSLPHISLFGEADVLKMSPTHGLPLSSAFSLV